MEVEIRAEMWTICRTCGRLSRPQGGDAVPEDTRIDNCSRPDPMNAVAIVLLRWPNEPEGEVEALMRSFGQEPGPLEYPLWQQSLPDPGWPPPPVRVVDSPPMRTARR